jgi:hypothetical protein
MLRGVEWYWPATIPDDALHLDEKGAHRLTQSPNGHGQSLERMNTKRRPCVYCASLESPGSANVSFSSKTWTSPHRGAPAMQSASSSWGSADSAALPSRSAVAPEPSRGGNAPDAASARYSCESAFRSASAGWDAARARLGCRP